MTFSSKTKIRTVSIAFIECCTQLVALTKGVLHSLYELSSCPHVSVNLHVIVVVPGKLCNAPVADSSIRKSQARSHTTCKIWICSPDQQMGRISIFEAVD